MNHHVENGGKAGFRHSISSYVSASSTEEEVVVVRNENGLRDSSSFAADSSVLQGGGSETESSKKNPVRRRSIRVRRRSRILELDTSETDGGCFVDSADQPLSSISDTPPVEDVAYCLIMLSQDRWERTGIERYSGKELFEDACWEGPDVLKSIKSNKVKGKYKCEACNKLFRSYQALGGHRASHKRIRVSAATGESETRRSMVAAEEEKKIHECPYCPRVFKSGQALGGHKRTHFTSGANATVSSTFSRIGENPAIRLNLPAMMDGSIAEENSRTTVSTADSDAALV